MLYQTPDDILHMEGSPHSALEWCQKQYDLYADTHGSDNLVIRSKSTTVILKRRHSFVLGVVVGVVVTWVVLKTPSFFSTVIKRGSSSSSSRRAIKR